VNHCIRHFEEPVAGVCRTCQRPFCDRCLVFSFGPKKPPYCVSCALNASGVRNGGGKAARPAAVAMAVESGEELAGATARTRTALDRRTARAERRAAKAGARAARKTVPADTVPALADAPNPSHDTYVPRPGQLNGTSRYDPATIDQLV
jgi:hypothetical protein